MTGWDFLNNITQASPPIAMVLFLIAVLVAVVILIIGFSRHGVDFIKHGFKQTALDASIESRFDAFESRFDDLRGSIDGLRTELKGEINDLRTEVNDLRTELDMIKVNHFGHLKNYLSVLDGILLDKNIISNSRKSAAG